MPTGMDTLMAAYKDEGNECDSSSNNNSNNFPTDRSDPTDAGTAAAATTTTTSVSASLTTPDTDHGTELCNSVKGEPLASEELSSDEISDDNNNPVNQKSPNQDEGFKDEKGSPNFTKITETEDDEDEEGPPHKKQKQLSSLTSLGTPNGQTGALQEAADSTPPATTPGSATNGKTSKKSKKKNNNVWTKPTSRKGKKKTKNINNNNAPVEETVLITPILRFPDKNDDSADMKICLSKVYKAEKVELSEDRMSASSCKGYRMVRATRGVAEGAWYFEIKVIHLGETGHTRLGWSTEKGDLQAPVGYDGNSFGYRDIDGCKIHKALREKYGEEGYKEGDVIGFYINLPEGNLYAPKPPHLVWYKGQRYACAPDGKEDPPKVVPGSEISFFKNGICQGVAFKDLYGGRYYPSASMYTLPNQPNCVVKFNFGPEFEFFPADFGDRAVPRPMIEVQYHGFGGRIENGNAWNSSRMCPIMKVVREQDIETVEADEIIR